MANALIIDSEAPVAQALKSALAARGVESHVTADGTEGLDFVKTDKPDIIVLCVELTRGSGYSVCNKLKKDPAMASIPLILTSSQATEETFEQHKKLRTRAEAYIKKPYTTESIMKTIGEYIKLGAAKGGSSEVELDVDELEVEIPHAAPAQAPASAKRANLPSDDSEFLDVNFDGDDGGAKDAPAAEAARPEPTAAPVAVTMAPEASSTGIDDSPMSRAVQPVVEARRQSSGQGDAELTSLRNEVKTLRQRVQRLEQEAQEKEVAFNDRLLAESARARDALESKKKLTQVEREIAKYQQDAAKAQQDAEAARAVLKDLQSAHDQGGNERSALTDKIAQLVDKVKELMGERDSLQRELAGIQEAQKNQASGAENADRVREKAKKAVDIAMQLLEETRLVH
jgi:CheY-like chemotaxis protein